MAEVRSALLSSLDEDEDEWVTGVRLGRTSMRKSISMRRKKKKKKKKKKTHPKRQKAKTKK
jgi:hypothetical protein